MNRELTPRQIVTELDRFVIGQKDAKRAVSIALRNRYRRQKLSADLRDEVTPKNILMIGPTGVGKTEIARRLAKLVGAPFVKVEATKFTEVGYVGRDVESMVRDLVEASVRLVKEEKKEDVKEPAERAATERLLDALQGKAKATPTASNPFEALFGGQTQQPETTSDTSNNDRSQLRRLLELGELEERVIEVELEEKQTMDLFQGQGMEGLSNLQDMLGQIVPKKRKQRKLTVREARPLLIAEEAENLLDLNEVHDEAVRRSEQMGIIFVDEIDKIATKSQDHAGVSREGVQRDILPIVEGSTVVTKYGPVKTDHVLFIAAGAFHMAKPSDLIPELQGRFPIRVELSSLTEEDFVKILTEPSQALIKQYTALLESEEITVRFTHEAIEEIAKIATHVNRETDDIGARRLYTIMERVLEDLSFEAADMPQTTVEITPAYVQAKVGSIADDRDLSQYIL
ncbi:ATP-dependent protease ATPase subunit HslU [Exiguobacterium profundum]|uniref:ATP-dependent protease ATPase subunit HslU n=1 Tax=Exiguobacterium profundum TaxID=307643 RepID=A0ABY8B0Y3_9BACL|nr:MULTISPECIES: ATP-dependent protease ATPase subunit HslU [Exiguobacterium]QPI66641.1 ATP-dependent protease ATPase subunit HslU [Exiguobacterium sp. PBE]MBQ6458956.1 ATP-dependent protease ATPase subunit HslU [Exiguobacterium sp.]MBR3218279.1 ATP-dependent protease ATPase subunit HslU [Exiguobacterium sp.]MCT4796963.1 ATP-dependent protease ATPase subunit HslU [Exiguobacterium profundum]MCV9898973.1 ATP-dependent protease ATPase subunit HslU [Exiguobacterium sp. N5]